MANEKNRNENVTNGTDIVAEVENTAEVVVEQPQQKLYVERKQFGVSKDKKKPLYDYFVKGMVYLTNPRTGEKVGKEATANFKAPDYGVFDLLDLIFEFNDAPPLLVEEMDVNGAKILKYNVAHINADGEVELAVELKPKESSDKSTLNNFLKN